MKFLLDENVPDSVADWLAEAGHDVRRAEIAGAADRHWAAESVRDQRLLVSYDKDFGDLVYRDGLACHGVILFRMDEARNAEYARRLAEIWGVVEVNPSGRFIIVTPDRVRVRLLDVAPPPPEAGPPP